jgi:ABC-type bacteriocin/lantibiotic exporter with double-glycine peptidase domain
MKVPLFKQRKNSCGTTSLRMVLSFFGNNVSENEIIRDVGGLKSYGVRTIKLAEFARKIGLKTKTYSFNKKLADYKTTIKRPEIKDITRYLRKSIPVIINVRHSLLNDTKITKEGHFIVVTGYRNRVFNYNDPDDGKEHTVEEEKLRFAWFNNALDSSAYLLTVWPKKLPK